MVEHAVISRVLHHLGLMSSTFVTSGKAVHSVDVTVVGLVMVAVIVARS